MYIDEHGVTHLTTRVIVMEETTCEICERPIQYRPDRVKPQYCDSCKEEYADLISPSYIPPA